MSNSATIFPGLEITSADTVIDIGCGLGRVCEAAGSTGAAVIGIDVKPDTIRHVEERMKGSPARYFRGLVSYCDPIPVPSSSCTVVVAQEVVEHVDNPPAFLREMHRVGTPNARYLISVPDSASERIMGLVSPPSYFEKPNHIHVFERAAFRTMLEEAGFVVERTVLGGFFWSMWWFFSQSASLPNSPVGKEELIAAWEKTWSLFCKTPKNAEVQSALNELIPKSQIYLCRKVASA